jgi:hypothetical protein
MEGGEEDLPRFREGEEEGMRTEVRGTGKIRPGTDLILEQATKGKIQISQWPISPHESHHQLRRYIGRVPKF